MVSQAELISKCYHSLVPGLISIFRDGMGPFNTWSAAQCLTLKDVLSSGLDYWCTQGQGDDL